MPDWRRHGLLAFTVNLQGGSPEGYSKQQPWENSAFDSAGELRPAYARVWDESSIAPTSWAWPLSSATSTSARICGCATKPRWSRHGQRNAIPAAPRLAQCPGGDRQRVRHRVPSRDSQARKGERIDCPRQSRAPERPPPAGERLLSRSRDPNRIRSACSDFLLLHGNGVSHPEQIAEMVRKTARFPATRPSRSSSTKTITSTLTSLKTT